MVKYNIIGKSVLAIMLLVSPLAFAETEYPASDFQPKVLYNDESYQHAGSTEASSSDSRYPAANFVPKVLYSDSEYKHKDVAPVAGSSKSSPASTDSGSDGQQSASTETAGGAKKDGGIDLPMIVGLAVVALAGFYFVNNKKSAAAKPASKATRSPGRSNVAVGQGTGVANYLAVKEGKATGVAKYLAGKEKHIPVTGVAKYVAKRVVAAKQAASEKVTGVEKYLRSKG